jgi:hypothetical protein
VFVVSWARFKSMRRGCLLALLLMPGALPGAHASTFEVLGGRSKTSGWRWTDAAFFAAVGAAHPFRLGSHDLTWAPDAELGWIGPRPVTRQNLHEYLTHPVWMAMGGARVSGFWRQAFFGFDVALTKNRTGALSSPYEFVSTLGWQGDRYLVALRHISNASFHEPNLGETMLLLGFRF